MVGAVAGVRQVGRCLVGKPEQLHHIAFAALIHIRRRPVHQHDGFALFVMSGDDGPPMKIGGIKGSGAGMFSAVGGSNERASV
jgi:hypothetical protein